MSEAFERASLRDVTARTQLWNPERGQRNRICYIDVSSVSREDLSIHETVEHAASVAPSRARKVVRADDTVFATVRPGLRRIAQVPATLDDAIASTAFCVLRPKPERVDPNFLFFAVSADHFVRSVSALETGASYPAVRDGDVLDQQIPIPHLSEQREIAFVLTAVRTSQRQNASSLSCASALKRAAMRDLFTRGLRSEAQIETDLGLMPESWSVVHLGDVCDLSTGTTPATQRKDYYDGETAFIKTAEIVDNRITSSSSFVSRDAIDDYSLKIYKPGTLLMAMYGQGKTRGQVALLEIPAATTQNAAAIQPTGQVDSAFLWHYLLASYERLRGMGSLGHISHLNLGYLRELAIKVPPLVEQHEMAAILDAVDKKIDLHKRKRAVLEDLFKSLLQKLMTGEIRVSDLDLSALQTPTADEATA